MQRAKTVDEYLENAGRWRDELTTLRKLLRATELEETVKWGAPCYTFNGQNVVGLAAFKSYFGLWFFQGALLEDTKDVLVNAQEGRTKAMRQWRFTSASEIKPRIISSYVREAMELARAGRAVAPDRNKPVEVPVELRDALQAKPSARHSFGQLTPGKQREYAAYISEAKRAATKETRLAKILPMIEAGVGLNDRYR